VDLQVQAVGFSEQGQSVDKFAFFGIFPTKAGMEQRAMTESLG